VVLKPTNRLGRKEPNNDHYRSRLLAEIESKKAGANPSKKPARKTGTLLKKETSEGAGLNIACCSIGSKLFNFCRLELNRVCQCWQSLAKCSACTVELEVRAAPMRAIHSPLTNPYDHLPK
jgi:hypothetical protein